MAVQVFSTKKDKPSAYPFLVPTETGRGARKYLHYSPIEFSISQDGKTWISCYDVPDLVGIYCYQAPDVQPANQTDTLKKVALQDGQRLMSSSYDTRQITMNVICKDPINGASASLGYDALQKFLVSRDPYWICFANWPHRMYRVKAKVAAPAFSLNSWTATVTFTDYIGLSRSVNHSINYSEYDGFGNNMPNDIQRYSFTSSSFVVNNQSDIMIDPWKRGHELKITCEGSSAGNFKLINTTTGSEIYRNGMMVGNEVKNNAFNGTYVIDGVRPTLDGKSDAASTNSSMMTLAKGPNHFKVENFSGKVTFDFPFWWLS